MSHFPHNRAAEGVTGARPSSSLASVNSSSSNNRLAKSRDHRVNDPEHLLVSAKMAACGAHVLEKALAKDESYPDLWAAISSGASAGSAARGSSVGYGTLAMSSAGFASSTSFSGDYVDDEDASYFGIGPRTAVAPLPRVLLDQYNRGEQAVFMGLLPEIRRVWVSIDSRLYLWHYDAECELDSRADARGAPDPSGLPSSDFCVYDGLDQTIVAVGLAPVKRGVFVPAVQYVLCVATAVECVLLAVTLGPGDDLALHPTGLAAPSDGVLVNAVVGSQAGRLFLAGRDGSLYELTYDDESWAAAARRLSRLVGAAPPTPGPPSRFERSGSGSSSAGLESIQCRKRNRSQSSLSFLVPAFVQHWLGGRSPLVALCVDETRNILFALSAASDIEVFDLGGHGQGFSLVGRISGAELSSRARAACSRLDSAAGPVKVVSVHPIPSYESPVLGLVAVTNDGTRLYFSTTRSSAWDVPRRGEPRRKPAKLALKHVRLAPPVRFAPGADESHHRQQSPASAGVALRVVQQAAYYGQGLFVLACAVADGQDALVVCRDDVLLVDDHGALTTVSVGATEGESMANGAADGFADRGSLLGSPGGPTPVVAAATDEPGLSSAALGSAGIGVARSGLDGFDMINGLHDVPFREQWTAVPLGARAFAVAEQPVPLLLDPRCPAPHDTPAWVFGDGATGISARSAVGARNPMATQHLLPPRRVLCLSGTGLHVVSELRPVDRLEQLLVGGRGAAGALAQFFRQYGAAESCAMCLLLCCARPPAGGALGAGLGVGAGLGSDLGGGVGAGAGGASVGSLAAQRTPHDQLALAAAQAFFQLGGRPSLVRVGADAAMAPVAQPLLHRSGMHNGLALYLGRILRPLWSHAVLLVPDKLVEHPHRQLSTQHQMSSPFGQQPQLAAGYRGDHASVIGPSSPAVPSGPFELRLTADAVVGVEQSLRALKQFLEAHPNFAPVPHAAAMATAAPAPAAAQTSSVGDGGRSAVPITHRLMRMQRRRLDDDAANLERQSLTALRALLTRALEAASFLVLLTEQDFDALVRRLSSSVQADLASLTFGELVCSEVGDRVTRALVDALIEQYAVDNVLVEAVSSRLRARCPSLFTEADRIRFKASEMLCDARARAPGDDDGRSELLAKACERFCSVASPRLDIDLVCGEFMHLRGYAAVVSVALAYARAVDPRNEALHVYMNDEPQAAVSASGGASNGSRQDAVFSPSRSHVAEDNRSTSGGMSSASAAALRDQRLQAYRWPIAALSELRDIARRGELVAADNGIATRDQRGQLHSSDDRSAAGGSSDPAGRPHLAAADASLVYRAVKQQCFESDDQMFHYVLYDWFLSASGGGGSSSTDERDISSDTDDSLLQNELLAAQTPFLERYLQSTSNDLLYKYYIRSGEFEKAATTLFDLAVRPGPRVNLADRLQHLARAKGCLGQAVSVRARGLLLQVQERLDVGRIQARVAQDLSEVPPQTAAGGGGPEAAVGGAVTAGQAVRSLNEQLYDLTELFGQFAQPFRLYRAQLAIVHCASHDDPVLVQRILRQLLPKRESVSSLAALVVQLGQEYYPSESVFPLPFLIDWLERIGAQARAAGELEDPAWLVHSLLRVGVSWATLFDQYANLLGQFTRNPQFDGSLLYRVHLHVVLLVLLSEWVHRELPPTAAHANTARRQRVAAQLRARGVADLLDQMALCLSGLSERELEAEGGDPRDLFVAANDAESLKQSLFS